MSKRSVVNVQNCTLQFFIIFDALLQNCAAHTRRIHINIFAPFYTFLKLNDLLGVVLSLGEILRRTLLDSNLTVRAEVFGRSVK